MKNANKGNLPATILLFVLLIAGRSASIPTAAKPLAGLGDKPARKTVRKKPVARLYLAWQVFTAVFGALFAAHLYATLSPVSVAGIPAAAAAAFLTLLMVSLCSAAVSYSWGNSLFSLIERKNRPMIWLVALFAIAAFAALRVDFVNKMLSLETVGFRYLPQTVIPAVLIALLYEFGLLLARAINRRK